jgi:Domain of unknown function (DUF4232)
MKSRLRAAGLAGAVAMVAALAAAGCGSKAAPRAAASIPSPSIRAVSERGAVPWANLPGQVFVPSPLPVPRPPATAPPCMASQVRVSPEGENGATGHLFAYFAFRNVSGRACILRGYPAVVASQPGKPSVTAAHSGWFSNDERSGNMRPGGVTTLSIETDRDCPARYAHPGTFPTLAYHTATIGIPGGGQVVIHHAFDVLCGLFTGKFAVAQPPRRYTRSPVAGAHVALQLPSGAVAGTTLDYVAAITNPAGTTMMLSPCPGYWQGLGRAGKTVLALNCRAQRQIPAHQTVRFAMRLQVPADTPTGPATVYWQIASVPGASAHGWVHIYGHDTPCRPSQLHARITGPGQIPGPPNLLGAKKMATDAPLTVTNISSQPCSVYGEPAVTVRAATGNDLHLRQVPAQQFSEQPALLPQTAIILAPRTGTARTTLYWYLPWCGPDPNPVTVTITLPANHATLTMTPVSWNPPACHRAQPSSPGNTGLLSADPFRPA